jgi:hypothetical protein
MNKNTQRITRKRDAVHPRFGFAVMKFAYHQLPDAQVRFYQKAQTAVKIFHTNTLK